MFSVWPRALFTLWFLIIVHSADLVYSKLRLINYSLSTLFLFYRFLFVLSFWALISFSETFHIGYNRLSIYESICFVCSDVNAKSCCETLWEHAAFQMFNETVQKLHKKGQQFPSGTLLGASHSQRQRTKGYAQLSNRLQRWNKSKIRFNTRFLNISLRFWFKRQYEKTKYSFESDILFNASQWQKLCRRLVLLRSLTLMMHTCIFTFLLQQKHFKVFI